MLTARQQASRIRRKFWAAVGLMPVQVTDVLLAVDQALWTPGLSAEEALKIVRDEYEKTAAAAKAPKG